MSGLLTMEELCDRLACTPATIHALRYRGEGPPAVRIGRSLKFDEADVAAWIDSRRERPKATL